MKILAQASAEGAHRPPDTDREALRTKGIMENKMEIVYWGNIGIMENRMETTTMENQMEKKMENEMETGITLQFF